MKPFARVAAALVAAATVLPPAALHAQRSLEITRFDATVKVEESGWIDVREEIQVRFTGSWNGIFRNIPVEYRTPQGFSFNLRLSDVSVTSESGEPLEFWSSRERHYRQLKIRVPGASDAERKVVIHYRIPNALRFQEEYDELYWNVTGDEWDMPIRAASAVLVLPPSLDGVRTASWTGGYGSTENAASVEEATGTLYFETLRPLNFREGLTVAVAWNPGVIERPSSFDKMADFMRANWLLFFPLLSLWTMWRLWANRGRDPRRLAISPQYEPPDGLTPAEAGTLVDNSPDMRDLTAGLVDLAVRGYLRIEERKADGFLEKLVGKQDYRLVPLRPTEEWRQLRAHEEELLRGIFGGGPGIPAPVDMSDLAHEFYTHLPAIKNGIFDKLVEHGYYERRPDKVLATYVGAAFAVLVLFGGAALWVAGWLALSPLTAILAAVGTALPVFVFAFLMPARTTKGARARERILGFEEFLERVEEDRYRRMVTTPEMFEKFLPYAMAFGVERKWAAAFEGMYKEPPDWYRGDFHGGFRPTYFVHSMGQMSTAAGTALGSGPRSSGGSGFPGVGASAGAEASAEVGSEEAGAGAGRRVSGTGDRRPPPRRESRGPDTYEASGVSDGGLAALRGVVRAPAQSFPRGRGPTVALPSRA